MSYAKRMRQVERINRDINTVVAARRDASRACEPAYLVEPMTHIECVLGSTKSWDRTVTVQRAGQRNAKIRGPFWAFVSRLGEH